jgi:hypothetical protein
MTSNTSHINYSHIQLSNKALYNRQRYTIQATEINKKRRYRWNNDTINIETTSPITTPLSTSRSQKNEQRRIKYAEKKKLN